MGMLLVLFGRSRGGLWLLKKACSGFSTSTLESIAITCRSQQNVIDAQKVCFVAQTIGNDYHRLGRSASLADLRLVGLQIVPIKSRSRTEHSRPGSSQMMYCIHISSRWRENNGRFAETTNALLMGTQEPA